MEQKVTSPAMKGVLIAVILILISLVGHVLGVDLEKWYGWVGIGIFLVAIVVGVNMYGKEINYTASFGGLFVHGFKITAAATAIVVVYTILSMYVIFPDTAAKVLQKAVEEAGKSGKMTDEQLEQAKPMMGKIIPITIIAGSLLGNLIVGCLGSLLGAAVTKKKPQDPFAQTQL